MWRKLSCCINKWVNLNPRGRKNVKHSCKHQIRITLFCSSLKLYLRFLCLHVFDPKLDHPDANVINSINNRVNLNSRGWKYVSRKTAFILFIFAVIFYFVQTIIFKVFNPKLDHPEATVINCVYTRINLYPRDRKHDKQIMSVGKQQYFILLGLLSSCKYDFSISQTIW